jgi:hypothetical protein
VIILDHEQGTEEWLAARRGKPSASMFSKLITMTGKPSSSAIGYIDELVAEVITGETEHFSNSHTERGTALEPEARESYEFITDNEVLECGFIVDTTFSYGCSPDGLVTEKGQSVGGLEIKCPAAKTQASYWRDPTLAVKKYWCQIQGCMWLTGRDWWDLFTYHPKMPHVLVRVDRDDEFIEKMAVEVKAAATAIKTQVEKKQ